MMKRRRHQGDMVGSTAIAKPRCCGNDGQRRGKRKSVDGERRRKRKVVLGETGEKETGVARYWKQGLAEEKLKLLNLVRVK